MGPLGGAAVGVVRSLELMFYKIILDESNLDVQRSPIAFAYRKQADTSRAITVIVILSLLREPLMTRSMTDVTGASSLRPQ